MILYKVLCILRVLLVLCPQSGYVHPDEHFQGPEIVYGDVAELNVHRTWEFTSSKPIRSIVFPYFITAIPAAIIRLLSHLQYKPDVYLLLVLPRLLICLLSFFQDICIYKICISTNLNYKPCLIFFSSSYVTLVYLTRTFSNSLESLYFAVLMFLLSQFLKNLKLFNKDMSNLYFRSYIFDSFMYGIILVLGFFNRPTFICFSVFPTIIWCYLILKMNIQRKLYVLIAFLLGAFSINMCLTIIDSFYYNMANHLSIKFYNNIIYTPLNFIFYNLNSENLDNHGLHPRWLHLFVNVPLLFSIYGIFLPIFSSINAFHLIKKLQFSYEMIFLLSFCVPLFLLSLIPHQEPRFLIPLIIPLSLLLGSKNFKNYCFFTYVWIMTNVLCLYFYGFIHQAGVYLSMQYISGQNNNNSIVIFYKTYMPPRYLLSLEKDKNTIVFDFAGCEDVDFKSGVQDLAVKHMPSNIFIVLPSKHLTPPIVFENLSKLNYELINRVHLFPHLSTENLPKIKEIQYILEKKSSAHRKLYDFKEFFSIQVLVYKTV